MPETRGQALEGISESFLNHRSNVGSWASVKVLKKLASRFGRRAEASSSGISSAGSVAERSVEGVESTVGPIMAGGLGQEAEELGTPVSPESAAIAMNRSEEAIELAILALPAPILEREDE
jgi:hypothetical protein